MWGYDSAKGGSGVVIILGDFGLEDENHSFA
jgi:hypothetical protein